MGLADYLDRAPDAGQSNRLLQQGAQSFGAMPMDAERLRAAQLQNASQQQANTDAAYTAPGAQASQATNAIGQHILARMRGTPGHNPEFEQRLLQELGQGGGAPQAPGAGLGPVAGPNAAPINMGNQGPSMAPSTVYNQPQGLAPGMPDVNVVRGPPAPPTPPQSMNGQPMRQPLNASSAFAQARNAPPAAPTQVPDINLTNNDVSSLQRMAPFLRLDQPTKTDPRLEIANQKDRLARDRMAQSQKFLDQEDALKRELARLSASVALTNGDSDRKAILAQMKMVNEMRIANIRAKAQQTSGIGGVVYDQQTQQAMQQEQAADAQSVADMEDLNHKLDEAMKAGPGGGKVRATRTGPQGPAPTGIGSGKIRVKVKASGETGSIPVGEFDANLYEKIPGGG